MNKTHKGRKCFLEIRQKFFLKLQKTTLFYGLSYLSQEIIEEKDIMDGGQTGGG